MNINQMHSWFNILLDHYNEPYFTDTETDEFLNAGTLEFVNDVIFKEFFPTLGQEEKGVQVLSSIESVVQGSEIMQPLLVTEVPVSSVDGLISTGSINTAITTAVGEPSELLHVINVVKLHEGDERLVRYVRHNDKPKFKQNVFKRPTARNPIFTFNYNGLLIDPQDTGDYQVSVVKRPRIMSLEDDISSDMPAFTHQRIMSYALSLAIMASRDDVLMQMQRATGNGTNRQ
jgi:hypothetical protein